MCWLFNGIFCAEFEPLMIGIIISQITVVLCLIHVYLQSDDAITSSLWHRIVDHFTYFMLTWNLTLEKIGSHHAQIYRKYPAPNDCNDHCCMQTWSRTTGEDSHLFKMIKCSSFSIKISCWNHISWNCFWRRQSPSKRLVKSDGIERASVCRLMNAENRAKTEKNN